MYLSTRAVRYSFNYFGFYEIKFKSNYLQLKIIGPKKSFPNKKFKNCLLNDLRKEGFFSLTLNDKGFKRFCNINMKVLNKHAPQKETFAKGNHQMSFMMKDFPKK